MIPVDAKTCEEQLRPKAFQDQRIPDEKSLGFSCAVGSAHHSTSIHGHITKLDAVFHFATGQWTLTVH